MLDRIAVTCFEFIWNGLRPFVLIFKYFEMILFKNYSIFDNVKPINAYLTRHSIFMAGCMNALFLLSLVWSCMEVRVNLLSLLIYM